MAPEDQGGQGQGGVCSKKVENLENLVTYFSVLLMETVCYQPPYNLQVHEVRPHTHTHTHTHKNCDLKKPKWHDIFSPTGQL